MTAATVTAENWTTAAACRNTDPDAFFDPKRKHFAAAVCAICPVLWQCLADVEAMPAHLRFTGQLRAGRWWPSRNLGARALKRRDTDDAALMRRRNTIKENR
jgi:hypothetical protein